LSDVGQIKAAIPEIQSLTDHVDLLINNAAGITMINDNEEGAEEKTAELMQVNCLAPKFFTKKLMPLLKKGTGKRAIMISSNAGQLASTFGNCYPNLDAYKITKAALNMATIIIASGVKNDNIIVVAINPGGVITPGMLSSPGAEHVVKEENGWMRPEVAAGRVLKIVDYISMADSGKFINHRFLDEHDAKEYKVYYPW